MPFRVTEKSWRGGLLVKRPRNCGQPAKVFSRNSLSQLSRTFLPRRGICRHFRRRCFGDESLLDLRVDLIRRQLAAAQEVSAEHGIPVIAITCLDDVLDYARQQPRLAAEHARLLDYRARYGVQRRDRPSG